MRTIVASKNRFLNILPIDATRVILNLLNEDPSTDYINGNYISVREENCCVSNLIECVFRVTNVRINSSLLKV